MNGPTSVGQELLAAAEAANGEEVILPWEKFYSVIGLDHGYVTPEFMDRVNTVLKPKGFYSVKNNKGVLIRHLH